MGNAVDEPNLERMLTEFSTAGYGGVEICPIYGAKGYESRFIPYLSPVWLDRLSFTLRVARRLGLGVDLTTGTGWPMGGPWVTPDQASESMRVVHGPGGYSLEFQHAVQKVKRAAPGGEGSVINPFSNDSLDAYLSHIDQAFLGFGEVRPRAEFHDSYEYYGANWAPDFPEQFRRRRGYDLTAHLDALAGDGDPEISARVRDDYRQTIADLHRDWIAHWTAWSHRQGSLSREQAHGSPSNLEDVYAAADIPETEGAFGGGTDEQIPMMKFASSAAHVRGRRLASSETFTWVGEHFNVTLAQLKPVLDRFFLAGINHTIYHGTPYSPADAPWPGFVFYAAENFGPQGGLWHDLPAFNGYVSRCQSLLQAGRPDNDVLLYFPVADYWQTPPDPDGKDSLLRFFATPGKWMAGTPFQETAMDLWRRGFSYDSITDCLLESVGADGGRIWAGGNHYSAIVIPPCRYLPVPTLDRLIALARAGATVIFIGPPPSDVPGWLDFAGRRGQLAQRLATLHLASSGKTAVGEGAIYIGSTDTLETAGIAPETMVRLGLNCLRRTTEEGPVYFIVNNGSAPVDDWVPLARSGDQAEILDPMNPERSGIESDAQGRTAGRVRLQLPPGGSLFVRLASLESNHGLTRKPMVWREPAPQVPTLPVAGTWTVRFLEGGPVLPAGFSSSQPIPWTGRKDSDADRFAGTVRYSIDFTVDGRVESQAPGWALDLGQVSDSAQVRLNGHAIGTVWCPPFRLQVGRYLRSGSNHLDIDVTSVAANRIRDLDVRHVAWKRFYDTNIVNFSYQKFDASIWPVRTAGLLGPVVIEPETEQSYASQR
jgi:hypothetical protein